MFSLLTTVVPVLAAPHKVQVPDPATAQRMVAKGGRLLADCGSYQLYTVETIGLELADATQTEIRDDYARIVLNAGMLTTTGHEATALRKPVGTFKGKQTHVELQLG